LIKFAGKGEVIDLAENNFEPLLQHLQLVLNLLYVIIRFKKLSADAERQEFIFK